MSHMSEGDVVLSNTRNIFNVHWEVGWRKVEGCEHEISLTYDYFFNRFTSIFVGVQLTDEEAGDRGILGLRYLLPLLIGASVWVDSDGEFRFSGEKDLPLTTRLSVYAEVEYDTYSKCQWQAGLNYILNKNFSLTGTYHSEFGLGAGISFSF